MKVALFYMPKPMFHYVKVALFYTKNRSESNNGPSNKFIFRATYGNSIV
jgi:hypothetical protein